MPRLIDYPRVLKAAEAAGLRCVYPNGAAFSLRTDPAHVACWAGGGAGGEGGDATIRPIFRDRVRPVAAQSLGTLCRQAWERHFPAATEAWLAPAHHWAAELAHHGSDALWTLVGEMGLDADALSRRTKADALAFGREEREPFAAAIGQIFEHLSATDFTLLLPGQAVVASLHHHCQVWWQCAQAATADALLTMRE